MKSVDSIALVKAPLYHYRKRKDGSTGSANYDKNFTAVEAYSRMIKDIIYGTVGFEQIYQDELLRQYVYWILRTAASSGRSNDKLTDLQEYIGLIPDSYNIDRFEVRQKINALRTSPTAYLRVERMHDIIKKWKKTIKSLIPK